ncbi:uncharacterized protein NPIL_330391 [Nephila pilipes]|uniref:Uncharacterized protein n=1 Tax=Nephila pilipes TaxID=299642 RepID=A0A8X6UG05_NEPPI|nr:uncharacterized protein NPIL_330391 [Nephila pilipes]
MEKTSSGVQAGTSNLDKTTNFPHNNTRNTNKESFHPNLMTADNFERVSSGRSEAITIKEHRNIINSSTDKPSSSGDAFLGNEYPFDEDLYHNILKEPRTSKKESHSSTDDQWEIISIPYSKKNTSLSDVMCQNTADCNLLENKGFEFTRDSAYDGGRHLLRNSQCREISPETERFKNCSTLQSTFQFVKPRFFFNHFQNTNEKCISDKFQKSATFQKKDEMLHFKNASLNNNTDLRKKKTIWSSSSINYIGIYSDETRNKTKRNQISHTLRNPEHDCVNQLSAKLSHTHAFFEDVPPNTISVTRNQKDSNINAEKPISPRIENSYTSSSKRKCNHSDPKSDLYVSLPKSRTRKTKTKAKSPISETKNADSKKSRHQFFYEKGLQIFIVKMMTDTHPNLNMASDVPLKIEMFLWDMIHRIGDEAETLIRLSSKKCLDKGVLKYAIKLCLEKIKNEADVVAGKRSQWLF